MKKFRWLFIILILIGLFTLLVFVYNPKISIGYNQGLFKNEAKNYSFEGRVGIFLKKTRFKTRDKVTCYFSYGYYKEEELHDFNVLIFINDDVNGMESLFEDDIDNFYSEEYSVIKPSFLSGDLKYAKYQDVDIDFSNYTKGTIGITLSCLDENNQRLEIIQEVSYEVKGNKVYFNN